MQNSIPAIVGSLDLTIAAEYFALTFRKTPSKCFALGAGQEKFHDSQKGAMSAKAFNEKQKFLIKDGNC